MRLIRKLVYRLGFRPKQGSIFHSPSWIPPGLGKQIVDAFDKGLTMAWSHEALTKIDRVVKTLVFCPVCGEKLETHPVTDQPACYLHGDFEVVEVKDSVRIEFKTMRW